MGNWVQTAVGVVLAGVVGTTVNARPPVVSVAKPRPAATKPVVAIAEADPKDKEIAQLRQQLAAFSESSDYAEAQALGIADAIRATALPERQQKRLAAAIIREARRNRLDPLLVTAVISVESSFNNYAVSPVGAMGLMQVMPETGKWLLTKRGESLKRKDHLFDYELNVELGTFYLAQLISRFGAVEPALVAYNAGPTAARRILAEESRRESALAGYPKKVLTHMSRLRAVSAREAIAAKVSDRG